MYRAQALVLRFRHIISTAYRSRLRVNSPVMLLALAVSMSIIYGMTAKQPSVRTINDQRTPQVMTMQQTQAVSSDIEAPESGQTSTASNTNVSETKSAHTAPTTQEISEAVGSGSKPAQPSNATPEFPCQVSSCDTPTTPIRECAPCPPGIPRSSTSTVYNCAVTIRCADNI